MSLRRVLFDNRNPAAWLEADRERSGFERAVVSSAWTGPPLTGVLTMPHVQPGVFRVDGVPVGLGDPSSFNGALGKLVDSMPTYTLRREDGTPVSLWRSGRYSVTALDLTVIRLRRDWVRLLVRYFGWWAAGLHLDYFGNLAWMGVMNWEEWDAAWLDVVRRLRAERSRWTLVGQQFHLTSITSAVDAIFVERVIEPGNDGSTEPARPRWMSLEDHVREMARDGAPEFILEIRDPASARLNTPEGQEWVRRVLAMVDDPGALISLPGEINPPLLSWGFGAQALVGAP